MDTDFKLAVKWNGNEYELDNFSENDSVATLKDAIFKQTGVRPERQKLLNLKLKGKYILNITYNIVYKQNSSGFVDYIS